MPSTNGIQNKGYIKVRYQRLGFLGIDNATEGANSSSMLLGIPARSSLQSTPARLHFTLVVRREMIRKEIEILENVIIIILAR